MALSPSPIFDTIKPVSVSKQGTAYLLLSAKSAESEHPMPISGVWAGIEVDQPDCHHCVSQNAI